MSSKSHPAPSRSPRRLPDADRRDFQSIGELLRSQHRFFNAAAYYDPSGRRLLAEQRQRDGERTRRHSQIERSAPDNWRQLQCGHSSGNSLEYGNGAVFTMEGGALNIAGRFSGTDTTQKITFSMSGGTLTVATVGHTASKAASTYPTSGSSFTMSGGTIVSAAGVHQLQRPLDYRNVAGTANITGGTIQFGNAATSGSPSFEVGVSSGQPVSSRT